MGGLDKLQTTKRSMSGMVFQVVVVVPLEIHFSGRKGEKEGVERKGLQVKRRFGIKP